MDVFGRPSNIWSYDGEEIGTYMNSELMVAEYTEAMTGEDLYNDIGRTADEKYNITVTMDGVEQALSIVNQIARRNDDDFTLSGTGVLTQVFVDVDEEEVYVSVINTYLAQATADYNDRRETASFEIWGVDRNSDGDYIKTAGSTEPSVSVSNDDVYVADIVEDEFVLVTLADGGIQSVADAEVVSDVTISAFSLNSYITADGNDYDYAETAMYAVGVLDAYDTQNLKEQTYNVYLDAYGNLIGLDIVDPADNYVFITGIEAPETSVLSNTTQKANAIFLDGTSKVIDVKAAKNAPALPTSAEEWHNQWYAYSESDGVYTLTLIDDNQSTDKVFQGYVEDTTAHTIDYAHTSLPIAAGGGNTAQRVYGNNDSVYLTADVDLITVSGNKHTIITKAANVVTGVRNASITTYTAADPIEVSEAGGNKNADSQLAHAAYVLFKSNGYIIGAVVVGSDDAISKNIVYVNSSQPSLEGYDSATGMWTWERKAILDGEEVVLRETSDVSTGGLTELSAGNMSQYSWYLVSYNADGFVTNAEIIDATEPATNLEYVSDYTGGAIQTAIDGSGIDAVVYEDSTNFSNVAEANLPTLIEQTLYLSTADADGFFLADDVKVVLIQQNNGKTTTEYNEGPSAVEAAISGLNAASDKNYDFVVNALIEDGAATVVIFEDVTNGGANLGDHSGNGDYSIAQDARFGGASNVNIAVNLEQGGSPVADGTDVTVTVQTYAQYTGWTDFAQYTITVDNGDGRLHLVNAANGIASQTSVRLVIETGDEPLVSNVIVKP